MTAASPQSGSPPGSPAEALYEQGMVHYQRREWQQALAYFRQVKDVEPNWPGLDSLIDEASWFLQLERVEARPEQPPVEDTRESGRGWPAMRWVLAAAIGLALVAVLAWWQGWIPGIGNRLEREALRNRGQASLAAGDYQDATAAFTELEHLAPGDPSAREGLVRAARLEQLAQNLQEAEAAVAEEDWDTAEAKLQAVLSMDASYNNAAGKLALVRRQREASDVFKAGVAAYDAGDRLSAITSLERLSEMDPQYRPDTVRELLFVLYVQDGQALLASSNAEMDKLNQAVARFGQAIALHPQNVQALDESRLANQYLEVVQAIDRQDLLRAEALLSALLQERPQYADGQAAALYYDLLVRQGDAARTAGDATSAAAAYQAALGWAAGDSAAALAGLAAVQATWTPTAEPAALPTPFVQSQTDTLNIRMGPGTDFPVIAQVGGDARLALIGRNAAGDWLVVCCVDEKPGWVAARLVRTDANIADLPVGLPPQRPPTATPVPTPQGTSTPTPAPGGTPLPTPTQGGGPTPEKPTPTPRPPTPTSPPPTPTPEPR